MTAPQTLAELLDARWDGLTDGRPVRCPACATGTMHPVAGDGPLPASGRCADCGAALA